MTIAIWEEISDCGQHRAWIACRTDRDTLTQGETKEQAIARLKQVCAHEDEWGWTVPYMPAGVIPEGAEMVESNAG